MISIIICSINPERFGRVCDMYSRALAGVNCQIVAVHDALSLAEGYNRAIPAATGELLIFSHDDVTILNPDFKHRLLEHMSHVDIVGLAGANRVIGGAWVLAGPPYVFGQIAYHNNPDGLYHAVIWGNARRRANGIKALDGVFLCVRREVVQSVQFDENTFTGFHGYDLDFTFRAYLAGYRLAVGCDLCVLHDSKGRFDESWKNFKELFRAKHQERLDVLPGRRDYRSETIIGVESIEELMQIMIPPWWD
jgi:GT2 family glycosyltransferase